MRPDQIIRPHTSSHQRIARERLVVQMAVLLLAACAAFGLTAGGLAWRLFTDTGLMAVLRAPLLIAGVALVYVLCGAALWASFIWKLAGWDVRRGVSVSTAAARAGFAWSWPWAAPRLLARLWRNRAIEVMS